MTAKADTTPLREGLELARDILRGPHYQGGASLMAIGRAFGAIDAALAEPVSRETVSDEIRPYLDAAVRHADGLSAQLEIPHWCPSRSHVEQARNTIRNIVNKARAALASEPVAGTAEYDVRSHENVLDQISAPPEPVGREDELAAEVKRLRDGLQSIVDLKNPLPRAAVREACAEILASGPALSPHHLSPPGK